ncbi:MAG: efflux RND transporter periplasmic adaptor subunit [Gammaproteobacteria bacterium]|nr:efflux RND transporter periplasmic adaptor subunit [Gammaproteobacteria bacterium]
MRRNAFMYCHNKYKVLGLILTFFIITACSDDQAAKNQKTRPVHKVLTVEVASQQVSIQKILPGTLTAQRKVQIFNQEEGLLTTLPFYEGDRVAKDSLLASLDDALIRAELSKATAALKQTKLDLDRVKNLLPRKLASEDEVAKARTAVDIAQAELNHQQTRLSYTRIRAPFDGIISERNVEPGDVVPVHSHMLSLIDTSSLKARVYVSELLLPLIKINDPVTIKIDALGDAIYSGQVIRSHPTIDANTRRGIIEVELSPVPEGALPGQLCRISLNTQTAERIMIPFDAVRHDKDGAYVFRVIDNKAIKTSIRTGVQSDQIIEVLDGINIGDRIVNQGFFGLKHNQAVSES